MLLVYAGIIGTILIENRDPGKSLAYILVLVFLPVIGLVVYYVVGRKPVFKKRVFEKKQWTDREKMQQFYQRLRPQMEKRLHLLQQAIGDRAYPFRYLFYQHQSLISSGNSVTLLSNGEEKFPALLTALQQARSHIFIEYYIFTGDAVGNCIADLLIQKKIEGLEVRVVVDDVGSNRMGHMVRRLRAAGIPLLKTLPVAFTSLANSNYRNHRKVVVIDGHIGFIGGINLDGRYWNREGTKRYWRDTAVRIEGPAVGLLQVQFLLSWDFAGGTESAEGPERYFHEKPEKKGDALVAIAASGPSSPAPFILETILLAIGQAEKTVRICTPYFIPPDALTTALVIAAARGVVVDLMLPARSDSALVQHASYSFLKPLLQRGVNVYLYQKGFLHSKILSIDSSLAFIGTMNMDTRSFFLNFEITSLIYDLDLCQALEQSFAQDKQSCYPLTLQHWQGRPMIQRGLESLCRLVAPIL